MYDTLLQNRKVRKQMLLTEEDNQKLLQVANLTNWSQNEIMNKALHAYLSRYDKKLQKLSEAV